VFRGGRSSPTLSPQAGTRRRTCYLFFGRNEKQWAITVAQEINCAERRDDDHRDDCDRRETSAASIARSSNRIGLISFNFCVDLIRFEPRGRRNGRRRRDDAGRGEPGALFFDFTFQPREMLPNEGTLVIELGESRGVHGVTLVEEPADWQTKKKRRSAVEQSGALKREGSASFSWRRSQRYGVACRIERRHP
jgi:hypothetical protein